MKILFNKITIRSNTYLFLALFPILMVGVGCNSNDSGDQEADLENAAAETAKEPHRINSLSEKEKQDGWKLLFDGESTKEWTGTKGKGFPEKGWVTEDGILTVLGSTEGDHSNGGDIITKNQYGNFELSLEFKIPKGANSGIKYFVVNDFPNQKGNYLGLEFQIIDDENHADAKLGKNGNRTMASLYDLIPAKDKETEPVGEWNHAKIIVKGNHVEHWLNGSKVLEYERRSDEFRNLVGESKYNDLQGFGEMPAGHILLQGHGDTVHYRNIKIRDLTDV